MKGRRAMLNRSHTVTARRRRSLEALVRHVAESSVQAICQLVADRVESMSLCEARGYVRARASREIRRQARLAFANQPGIDPSWETLVVLRATERAAPLALQQLTSGQRRRIDGGTPALRRAA
jgi:hypothetical protein